MATAYAPGLEVSARAVVRKVRELPLLGQALVKEGQFVKANDPVLSAEIAGELDIIRVADKLGIDPTDVLPLVKIKVGDNIEKGQLICELKSFFGMFSSTVTSPYSGTVEFFTELNSHLGVRGPSSPILVNAYVPGKIVEVEAGRRVSIETIGAFIQGIFGVGGEQQGDIFALDLAEDALVGKEQVEPIISQLKNKTVIGGASVTKEALELFGKAGIAALITGSAEAELFDEFVGSQIGVSITGDEDVPFTLIITEGFGRLAISPMIVQLARKLNGRASSVSGATQVRAGAMRPEVIIPDLDLESSHNVGFNVSTEARALTPGTKVRVVRVPYFGEFVEITELPHDPEKVPSGAVVRVLRAKRKDGTVITVPRANVEIVASDS